MDLPQDMLNMLIGLGILLGALQCFSGYRIFKAILGFMGFLLGGAVAGAIGFAISEEPLVALIAGIIGGVIGAALLVALYFVGVFCVGAFLGVVLATVVSAAGQSEPQPVVLAIAGLVGGVIALALQKVMIVLATAFGGAWNVAFGIAYFATDAIDPKNIEQFFRSGGTLLYMVLLGWLLLGIVGVVVQYRTLPEEKAPAKGDDDEDE